MISAGTLTSSFTTSCAWQIAPHRAERVKIISHVKETHRIALPNESGSIKKIQDLINSPDWQDEPVFSSTQYFESFLKQRNAAVRATTAATQTVSDPLIGILGNFDAIPDQYRHDMFSDFRTVCERENFRGLLDTISDWAATAELYASPSLGAEVQEAIGGRQEVGDWVPG